MPVQAYRIGVDLVMNQTMVVGPLEAVLQAMLKVEEAQKRVQAGLNEMKSTLRGAASEAAAFARAMGQAAGAAERTARAAPKGAPRGAGVGGAAESYAAGVAGGAPRLGYEPPSYTPEVMPRAARGVPLGVGRDPLTIDTTASPTPLPALTDGTPRAPTMSSSRAMVPVGPAYGGGENTPRARRADDYIPPFAANQSADDGFSIPSRPGYMGGGNRTSAPNFTMGGRGGSVPPYNGGGGDDFDDGGFSGRAAAAVARMQSNPHRRTLQNNLRSGGTEMGLVAFTGYKALDGVMNAGLAVGHGRYQLIQQKLTDSQADAAVSQAYKLQQTIPGISVPGALEITKDLMTVLAPYEKGPDGKANGKVDTSEIEKLAPVFAKLSVVLQSMGGAAGQGEALMAAIRAGEYAGYLTELDPQTGKMVINANRLVSFVQNLMAVAAQTGGTIGPQQMLEFLRGSGYGGKALDSNTLFAKSIALQIDMGSTQAGRGFRANAAQFATGRMSQATAERLTDQGVLKAGAWEKNPIGNVFLNPDAYVDPSQEDVAEHDPTDFWLNYVLPHVQAWEAKKYKTAYTKASPAKKRSMDTNALIADMSREPNRNVVAQVMSLVPQMDRDITAQQALSTSDFYGNYVKENPQTPFLALGNAFQAFEAQIGTTAMPVVTKYLGDLTDVLNRLTNWAQGHPDQVKQLFEGAAIAVGVFAVGSVAAGALLLLSNPVTGIPVLAAAILGLGNAFSSIPPDLMKMLLGFATGYRMGGPPGAIAGLVGGFVLPDAVTSLQKDKDGKPTTAAQAAHDRLTEKDILMAAPMVGLYEAWRNPALLGFGAFGAPPATVKKESYETSPEGHTMLQPISLEINLDGKRIAANTAKHLTKAARPGGPGMGNGVDYRALPRSAGTTVNA